MEKEAYIHTTWTEEEAYIHTAHTTEAAYRAHTNRQLEGQLGAELKGASPDPEIYKTWVAENPSQSIPVGPGV